MADFRAYTSAQLAAFGRAVVQGSGLALSTESGSDVGVTLDATAKLLVGAQVAAKYAYDQLLPGTASAQTLSDELDRLAIDYSKGATKARGRMIVVSGTPVPAGTRLDIPATAFADGVARTVVTSTGYEPRANVDGGSATSATVIAGDGSTRTRIRIRSATNTSYIRVGDVLFTDGTLVTSSALVIVTAINTDQSFSVWPPLPTGVTSGSSVTVYANVGAVEVEADSEGATGNAPAGVWTDADTSRSYLVLGLTGGSDGQERQPSDIARVAAWVQDHRAWPPGGGNAQHWREIALKCPTVMLDDAVVYMGARGRCSVDIVAIGASSRASATGYADARVDFLPGAANGRVLAPGSIAELQAWCDANAAYHDDVRVWPVTHSLHGQGPFSSGDRSHFSNIAAADIVVTPSYGYGNDCGANWMSIGHPVAQTNRLIVTGTMPAFKVGHRVWLRLTAASGDSQICVTAVARITAVSRNRDYVTVPDFAGFLRLVDPSRIVPAMDVADWGSAGPLTQPVLDAVYGYYDALGPGSYVTPDYGSGYQLALGHTAARSFASVRVRRWPSEGYRWSSGVRTNMLLAKVRAIPGVVSAAMAGTAMAPMAIDYDPAPLKTAALGSVRVRTL